MEGSDGEIDRLDTDERRDEAAKAVDRQVARKQLPRADRAIEHPLQSERDEAKLSERVREATSILRKIEAPSVSKLARYTRKPKGLFGSSLYYAKDLSNPSPAQYLDTASSTERESADKHLR